MTSKNRAEVLTASSVATDSTAGRTDKQVLQEEAKRVCPICGDRLHPYRDRDDLYRVWLKCDSCGHTERERPFECDTCGTITCGNRGNPNVINCQQKTPNALVRAMRDQAANERGLPGRS